MFQRTTPKTGNAKALPGSKDHFYPFLSWEEREETELRRFVGFAPVMPNSKIDNSNIIRFSLKELEITSNVCDSSASTVLKQVYVNGNKGPVEAFYQMPLLPGSTVCNFEVMYDDKHFQGRVKESEKASNQYSDQIASGGYAMLVEKTENGFFKLSIGNIPPTKEITILITIVSETNTSMDKIHYCLHRYMFPSTDFKLTGHISVSLSSPIQALNFDNYGMKVKYSKDKKEADIKYSSDSGIKRNILVSITPTSSQQPAYFIQSSKDSYAIGLNFYPHFDTPSDEINQRAEMIFLLDCSGSMSNQPIKFAKRCLDLLMRSLTESVKFNIYLFGSSFRKLYEASKEYNDETLGEANKFIASIDADMGGTELLAPIRDILSSPYDPAYPRQLFILTDGQVSNRNQLIAYVGKESNSTRCFTLGIGTGVDRDLVMGLSGVCRGGFRFISDNKSMEEQVLSLLRVAMEPTLSNISIDWNAAELQVTQAPKIIRPIYNHERMMVYALVEKKLTEAQKVTVTLTGNGPTGSLLTFPIQLDFSLASSTSNHLHAIAALSHINDLEEEERKLSSSHKDRIVELGKKYSLISKHTSFIITIDSTKPTQETMTTVDILDNPRSYPSMSRGGGIYRARSSSGGGPGTPIVPPPRALQSTTRDGGLKSSNLSGGVPGSVNSSPSGGVSFGLRKKNSSSSSPSSSSSSSSSILTSTSSSGDELFDFIKQQKANGSWCKEGIPFKIPEVPNELSQLPIELWITLLAIVYIKNKSKNQSTDLVIQKAIKWVKQQLTKSNLTTESFDQFSETAKKSLQIK